MKVSRPVLKERRPEQYRASTLTIFWNGTGSKSFSFKSGKVNYHKLEGQRAKDLEVFVCLPFQIARNYCLIKLGA